MTTDPHDELGEILRRALNAEADEVIPGADGLEKIRTRIDERRRPRFGWDWFTVNWARPLVAVAVAVVVACVGVTAPQAIEFIQSTADHGPSGDGGGGTADGGHETQGLPPYVPPSASPRPDGSGDPSKAGSPSPAAPPGAAGCAGQPPAAPTPPPSASAAPEANGTPPPAAPQQPCPSSEPPGEEPVTPTTPETGPSSADPTEPVTPPTTEDQTGTGQSGEEPSVP
jgi:hypothetical protein